MKCFSLVVALMAIATGFAQDEESMGTVIGIDLGTTYSCVGVFQNDRVEIIANDQGNRITPSYVAWDDAGERLIGDAAKNQATINPENTVFDVKRLIGRKFNEKSVQADKKLFPFALVPKDDKPYVQVILEGGEKKSLRAGGDQRHGPHEDALHRRGLPRQRGEARRRHGAGLLQRRAAPGDEGRWYHFWYDSPKNHQRAHGRGHRLRHGQEGGREEHSGLRSGRWYVRRHAAHDRQWCV